LNMAEEHPRRSTTAEVVREPPVILARHATRTGEIQLQRRKLTDGSDIFEIISDGVFLMSSQFHLGEQILARQAVSDLEQVAPPERRVLIGGLGMGFTLREALDHPVARVDVVEISDHVIDWNRRFFSGLNKSPLSDQRTQLIHDDLYSVLNETQPASYAAVILDVDNGPSWLAHEQNARLYTNKALATWNSLLVRNGVLAVWSAQKEPEFVERMSQHFAEIQEAAVPIPGLGGRVQSNYVYRGIRS